MASAFVGGVVSAPYIERKYSWHYGYVKMYEINRGIKNNSHCVCWELSHYIGAQLLALQLITRPASRTCSSFSSIIYFIHYKLALQVNFKDEPAHHNS